MTTDERLLAFHPMGSQASNIPMHSSLLIVGLSWSEYVEKFIQPQIDWGIRRFVLHLPFGRDSTERGMNFDSYLIAREQKIEALYRGFGKAMRSLTRKGIEVICYMGSLVLDPRMAELKIRRYGDDNWLDRFMHSIRPCINAECSIAFDAAGGNWDENGPEHYAAKTLRALGTMVYIEGTATPPERARWLQSFDWLANTEHYWRNIADGAHGNTRPGATPDRTSLWAQADEFEGQGTLMLAGAHAAPMMPDGSPMPRDQFIDTYHLWAPEMVRTDLAAGFHSAVYLWHISDRMTIDEMLTGHVRPPTPSTIPTKLTRRARPEARKG